MVSMELTGKVEAAMVVKTCWHAEPQTQLETRRRRSTAGAAEQDCAYGGEGP